jgi:diguanylate cyclase (GGDEF)-like protein
MSDINGLRLINEVYSLTEGDKALMIYSKLLKDIFPSTATIARIGGDEFCVILTEPHLQKATQYVKRLTSSVNHVSINELPLTVAIGYAEKNDDTSIFEAIALAEKHMLKNKLLIHNSSRNSIVKSLQTALFERSDETEQHANRMSEMCYKLGKKLHLKQNELDDLKLFALLHDIGKIGVGDQILNKPSKLTDEEYVLMQQHPLIGYKIANSVEALKGISNYILTHHEWWDGTGYPNQLKHDDIPLLSRILSIVDAWDAMTNDRVYRKAISEEMAVKEIIDHKGSQFDPLIADQFIQCIQNKNCI